MKDEYDEYNDHDEYGDKQVKKDGLIHFDLVVGLMILLWLGVEIIKAVI